MSGMHNPGRQSAGQNRHQIGTMERERPGVRQPSIGSFLSEKVDLSDEQLDRLLACVGYRLQVTRRPVVPELARSERRSWKLHRQLARHLNRPTLIERQPTIHRNLHRLRTGVTGQPHMRNLDRWESLLESDDVPSVHRVLTDL
jgi:hypothetical protein